MSNSASNQISSTISLLVDQCCEDNASFNDFSSQIVMFVKQNQSKEVRIIIDAIKKIIKNKKKDSPSKLLALKLLNDCLTQANNEEFLNYTDTKIMRRLGQFARFKKESNDIERGALLFGQNYNQKSSADFLKLLLIFIQKWAQTLRSVSGRQTEISKIYQTLVREKVAIPSEEAVYSSLNFDSDNVAQQQQQKGQQQKQQQQMQRPQSQAQIQQNQDFNKQQFQSHQQPLQQQQQQQRQQPQRQSQSSNEVNVIFNQQQFKSHQQPLNNNNERQPQSSDRSNNNISQSQSNSNSLSKEEQVQFQRNIKEDYKKLTEHHNEAKFAEELLQMGGDSGDQLDDQLLKDLRTQLTNGKQFCEEFLKRLMESPIQIKDQESKINKILVIIGEISTTLEKILIFKPYSPRALKEIEEKRKQEIAKQTAQTNNQQPQSAGLNSNRSKSSIKVKQNDRQDPARQSQQLQKQPQLEPQNQIKSSVKNSNNKQQEQNNKDQDVQQVRKQSQSRNKSNALNNANSEKQQNINKDNNDPFKFQNAANSNNNNNDFNQDIFKTNFKFQSDQFEQMQHQLNHDSWGTNSAAAFSSQQQLGNNNNDFNFNFNPIKSSFDPFTFNNNKTNNDKVQDNQLEKSQQQKVKDGFDFSNNNKNEKSQVLEQVDIASPAQKQIEMIKPKVQAEKNQSKAKLQEQRQPDIKIQQPVKQKVPQNDFDFDFNANPSPRLQVKEEQKQNLNVQQTLPNVYQESPSTIIEQSPDPISKIQQIQRKTNEKMRVSSKQANLQLPQPNSVLTKPQMSSKPMQKPDDFGMSMKDDANSMFQFTMTQKQGSGSMMDFGKGQNGFEDAKQQQFISPSKSSLDAPRSSHIGIQMKQQAQLHNINESPDADLSDEDEVSQLKSNLDEKDQFRFPSPSTNQKALRQIDNNSISQDFDWNFNQANPSQNVRQSISNKPSGSNNPSQQKQQLDSSSNINLTQNDAFGFDYFDPQQQQQNKSQIHDTSEQSKPTPKSQAKQQQRSSNNIKLKVMQGLDNTKSPFTTENNNTMNQSLSKQDLQSVTNFDSIPNSSSNKVQSIQKQQQQQQKQEHQQEGKFDFNFDDVNQQENNSITSTPIQQKQSQSNNDELNQHIIKQLNDTVLVLENQIDNLQLQNNELKMLLNGSTQKQKDLETKSQQQNTQVSELQNTIKTIESDKSLQSRKIEELEVQVKQFKKFEFLYEQEQFAKTELSNQVADLQYKCDEYKKMADRQESHLQKRDKEIERLKLEVQKLENQVQEVREQSERDIENAKQSEAQTKIVMMRELQTAKSREEEVRVMLQCEIAEIKKREENTNKKHQQEISHMKEVEDQLRKQIQEEQNNAENREKILKDLIQSLQQQNEDLKSKQKESPQQKLVIRASAIKFGKESSAQSDQKYQKQKSQLSSKKNSDQNVNKHSSQQNTSPFMFQNQQSPHEEVKASSDYDFNFPTQEQQQQQQHLLQNSNDNCNQPDNQDYNKTPPATTKLNQQNQQQHLESTLDQQQHQLFDDLIKTQSIRKDPTRLDSDTLTNLDAIKINKFYDSELIKKEEDQFGDGGNGDGDVEHQLMFTKSLSHKNDSSYIQGTPSVNNEVNGMQYNTIEHLNAIQDKDDDDNDDDASRSDNNYLSANVNDNKLDINNDIDTADIGFGGDSDKSDDDLKVIKSLEDLDVRDDLSDNQNDKQNDNSDDDEEMPYVPSSDSDKEDPTLTIQQENQQHNFNQTQKSNRSMTQNHKDFAVIKQNPVFSQHDSSQETSNLLQSNTSQSDQLQILPKNKNDDEEQKKQQPSNTFDFSFPTQQQSPQQTQKDNDGFQQIEMITKPLQYERKQSHANAVVADSAFDFSFPVDNNNDNKPLQTVVLDSGSSRSSQRIDTSPMATSQRSFKQSVIIQSDTKSDIIPLPIDNNNKSPNQTTNNKYQSQYNQQPLPEHGPSLNTQNNNNNNPLTQTPRSSQRSYTMTNQLQTSPSPLSNKSKQQQQQYDNASVNKKDSFMDMFGDILEHGPGGNSSSAQKVQTNSNPTQQQQQAKTFDLNFDDLLGDSKIAQQKSEQNSTPIKNDNIQNQTNNNSQSSQSYPGQYNPSINKMNPPTFQQQTTSPPNNANQQVKGGFDFSLFEEEKQEPNHQQKPQNQQQQQQQQLTPPPFQTNTQLSNNSQSPPFINMQGVNKQFNKSPISVMNTAQNEPLRSSIIGLNQPPQGHINHSQFQTHNPILNQVPNPTIIEPQYNQHQKPVNQQQQFSSSPMNNPSIQQQQHNQFVTNVPSQQQQSHQLNPPLLQQQQMQNNQQPVNLLSPNVMQNPLYQQQQQQQQQVMFTPAKLQTPNTYMQNNSPSSNPQFGTPMPSQFNNSPIPPHHQNTQQQQLQPTMIQPSPDGKDNNQKDIVLDKSQFTTVNTEQYAQDQKQQQTRGLDASGMMRMMLQQFFRKSLMSNKCVLFEDSNIQVGMLSDFQQGGLVRMRMFLGNKNQNQTVTNIKLVCGPSMDFQMQQNRDFVPSITHGQQEPIDLVMKVSSFQLTVPIYQLAYQINNQHQPPIAIRLPIVLMKFCQSIPNLDTQGYIYKWNFECNVSHEFKQTFNVDFNQCRSLSQLKEVLQFGKQNTIAFVDGVEQQKNIVCGGTQLQQIQGIQSSQPLQALIKITITANGQNCEIVGRSNDSEVGLINSNSNNNDSNSVGVHGGLKGKFVQHVMSNILEMIALQVHNSSNNNNSQ